MCFEIPYTTCIPAAGQEYTDNTNLPQTACGTTITVPTYLSDGSWTLQWAWWGGYSVLGDYYSCVDYIVSGGTTYAPYPGPYYLGGDRAYPSSNNMCEFRNTDRIGVCVVEACSTPIFPLGVVQSGPPLDRQGNPIPVGSPGGTPAPPPASGAAPPPATPTTGSVYTTGQYTPPYTTGTPYTPPYTTGNQYTPPYTTNAPGSSASTATSMTSTSGSLAAVGSPCKANTDCNSNVCDISGSCAAGSSSKSGLTSGGIAAIVFAALVLIIAGLIGLFFYVNKKEVPYMVPFKGRV